MYGGERSDLASCPKPDRDLHVYVGLLQSVDKDIFHLPTWLLPAASIFGVLHYKAAFVIQSFILQFPKCIFKFSFKYTLMHSNKLN